MKNSYNKVRFVLFGFFEERRGFYSKIVENRQEKYS